jgi:hypothetical protein
VAKARTLAVSKQHTVRLEKYRVEISNRFAALKNLDTAKDINESWETVIENIKISAKEGLGYYELKKNKHGSMKDAKKY